MFFFNCLFQSINYFFLTFFYQNKWNYMWKAYFTVAATAAWHGTGKCGQNQSTDNENCLKLSISEYYNAPALKTPHSNNSNRKALHLQKWFSSFSLRLIERTLGPTEKKLSFNWNCTLNWSSRLQHDRFYIRKRVCLPSSRSILITQWEMSSPTVITAKFTIVNIAKLF